MQLHLTQADVEATARAVADQFAELEFVESVVLGGSQATGKASPYSDIDLYIFVSQSLPVEARAGIIEPRSSRMELNADYWETEDYWLEKTSGIKVEAIYRDDWLEKDLQTLFEHDRAQMGFSTSLWHSVVTSKILFDRSGWFASLKKLADRPYPDSLAKAIIQKNFPLLRGSLIAHPNQLSSAIARNDRVFVNNLLYMVFNSYFDILFALNHALHPGSKRQLAYAEALPLKPEKMSEDVNALMTHDLETITDTTRQLIDRLEKLLKEQRAI